MDKYFKDKAVIITGGSSGIGKALAEQLIDFGAHIIVADRQDTHNRSVDFKRVDMASAIEAEKFFEYVLKKYGHIDYVFNSAGIFMGGEIRDTPIENWHTVTTNNIFAIMNGSHFAYQAMLGQGTGHIVNFGSAAGLFPVSAMGIYGSTKFAIVGLSMALRNEAKKLGVKVSVVCPTIVNTPLYDTAIYNSVDTVKALKKRDSLQSAEKAAHNTLKGVVKNKAIIHTAVSTRFAWMVYRFSPVLYGLGAQRIIGIYRKTLRKPITKRV